MDSPTRLRVLRIADVHAGVEGGARNYMLRSGAELESIGHEVSYRWREDMLPNVRSGGLRRILVPWWIALTGLRERKRWDVIEVHEPTGAVYGVLRVLLRRRVLPPLALLSYGLEVRGWAALRERARRSGRPIRLKSRVSVPLTLVAQGVVAARTADVVIVPSTSDEEHLMSRMGVPARRIMMAPSGVEEEYLAAPEHERAADTVKLIFVGSWIDRKGVPELSEAWEALAADTRLRLTLAGTGLAVEKVLASFSSRYADRVTVIPKIEPEALRAELLDHHIFVLPSWFEGMPLSMLEAAACGLPCVVTSVCGVRDVFPAERAESLGAITVEPHDGAALTAAIASLIDDPERRAELGRRARSRARSFTWAAGAQRIASAYARVVGVDEPMTLSELPRTHAP